MVDTAFLAVGGVVFLLLLVVILYSASAAPAEREKPARAPKAAKGKKKAVANKKTGKKPQQPAAPASNVKEIFTVGESRSKEDDRNMLEFLKGRDPQEIARVLQRESKQSAKGKKKTEVAKPVEALQEQEEDDDDFSVIQRKTQDKPKPKEPKETQEKKKKPKSTSFFKEEKKPVDPKAPRRPRREEGAAPADGENKQEGERPPRRERAPKLNAEGEVEERRPRDSDRRPPRKPIAVPTMSLSNIEPDVNSFLDLITADEERKAREASRFSILERRTVLQILSLLTPGQLLALSRVNKYFHNICKSQALWQSLAMKDFGIKSLGKHRNWMAAYKNEYKRRHNKHEKNGKEEKQEQSDTKKAQQEEQ